MSILVYLKPIQLFIIIRLLIFWGSNNCRDIILFWILFLDQLVVIKRVEKGYILKTHQFPSKMLAGVCFIPLLDISIDAGNQLCFYPVVRIFE